MAEWHTFHSCSNATHGRSWANRFFISCSYCVILGSGSEKSHVLRGKVKPIIYVIHGVLYLIIILQSSSQRLQILTP